MRQISKDTYEDANCKIEFGNRFSFEVTSKKGKIRAGGVYYYTGRIELIPDRGLPKPIFETLVEICKQRHKEGLMPNK